MPNSQGIPFMTHVAECISWCDIIYIDESYIDESNKQKRLLIFVPEIKLYDLQDMIKNIWRYLSYRVS